MKTKKTLMIGMMLLMISSCIKQPAIYPLFSEEDLAVIPYQMGQTVKFLNEDNDTIVFQVVRDEVYPSHTHTFDETDYGMETITVNYYYVRDVDLTDTSGNITLSFSNYSNSSEKEMNFRWNGNFVLGCELLASNETFSVNSEDAPYEHVHHERLYNQYTGEMLYDWYYNEEFGLLYFKKGDFSLTRIP